MISNFNEMCIDIFEHLLNRKDRYLCDFANPIFTYALKGGLIGQYAETYCINGLEMKFWDVNYATKKYKGLAPWRVLLSSEKAISLVERIEKGLIKYSKNGTDYPYYEHIEPKNLTYKKILEIENPTEEKIANAFKYCDVIMITHEESKYLDAKQYDEFSLEDEEIIRDWNKTGSITDEVCERSLNSMKNERGIYISSRDNGNAYARVAHLVRYGVKFRWGCDPKPYNEKSQAEIIRDCLENTNRVFEFK